MAMLFRLRELTGRWEIDHRARLSLEDLSQQTGISPQVLSKMGDPIQEYATSSRHIEILCRFFRVTPDELILFDPPIKEEVPEVKK